MPVYVPQANALRRKINDIIDIEKCLDEDKKTYTAYAYRTRDIVVREALTTYIANGCVREDCEDYWLWVYSQLMTTKLDMFGERAAVAFQIENSKKGGRKRALVFMPREFTFEEFATFCAHNNNICKDPKTLLARYKRDKLITEVDGKYIISDEVCKQYGIT